MDKLLILLFLVAPVQLFSMHIPLPHPGWPSREALGIVGNLTPTVAYSDGSIEKESRDEFPEYRVLSRVTIFGDNGKGRVEVLTRLVDKGNEKVVDTRKEDYPSVEQGLRKASAITRTLLCWMQ